MNFTSFCDTYPLLEVLAVSVAVQRHNGRYFKPYGCYPDGKVANGDLVRALCDTPGRRWPRVLEESQKIQVTDADREQAGEIIDYFQCYAMELVNQEKVSDFDLNMIELARKSEVSGRDLGLVAVMPHIHNLKQVRDDHDDINAKLKRTSEFVGTPRKRNELTVKVEYTQFIRKIDAYLFVCSVDGKHLVKFFNQDQDFMTVGETYQISAYVKSHEVGRFSNARETMVNRIKILK